MKLRVKNLLEHIKSIFVNADLTPLEQKKNKRLHEQLKEMNKEGKSYFIKKWINSAGEELIQKTPPCTDNENLLHKDHHTLAHTDVLIDNLINNDNYPSDNSHITCTSTNRTPLQSLAINFLSIMAKRSELRNLINDHYPDIIFRSKTWLSPDINTAEFFPLQGI